jgi:hypothetical protein
MYGGRTTRDLSCRRAEHAGVGSPTLNCGSPRLLFYSHLYSIVCMYSIL